MISICYILIVLLIFFGDLYIKNRIEKAGPEIRNRKYFLIRKYHNKGAMLNLGQHKSRALAVLSVFLCLVLTAAFLLSLGNRGNNLLRSGLALLLGGAFSNTYDRLKRKYVVDYFSFQVKWTPLRRIVYNLSDFCIIIGALLAVLGSP